ncbi:T9SS sorting signal type C domain-containing protein, partial [Flavobacterium alvei]
SLKVNDLAFDENSISVYKQNGVLNINAGNTTMKSVKVFDVTGRLVLEQKSVNATTTALKNLAAGKQALLIQITSDDNRVVTKKAIN